MYKEHQGKKKKNERRKRYHEDDNDEDEDETYHLFQDYNDDSQVDPAYRPIREELRKADEEGDS